MKRTTDPIAQLMQEHDEALLQLKHLSKAVQAISHEGYEPKHRRALEAALKFIKEEVSVHNRKEETALFPVLERYVEGPTRIMRNDHKKLKAGFRQLATSVQQLRKRQDSFSAIKQLSIVTKDVVQLFVNHIHKENHILFPLVQEFLSKDELREIARKML